ncbi:MAG: LamG-like jellyroll fold domain-containing protein, partial [Dehalococcoidia bacterium]|nr:LamG-like jellyroll fold domain-containing protein [Dehalococcoidia bacterium]
KNGDVLVFDGSSWSTSYTGSQEAIYALAVYNGKLYAGQGYSSNSGDVLVFDGSTWSTSYDGSTEAIYALAVYNGKLYAGTGIGTGEANILVFDGNTWSTSYVASAGVSGRIYALAVYNGKLYASQGLGIGYGDMLVFDGSTWTTSYNGSQEAIYVLAVYNGKLYAGQGYDSGDGDVLVLNAGNQAQSTTTSWSTSFYSVTATKSSTTLTLYVDGAQQASTTVSSTVETNALNLLIGKVFGSRGTGVGEGLFKGIIDESRISNTARSSQWITTEYNNQNSPSTFYSLGPEVGNYVPSGTVASQVHDSGSNGAIWTELLWTETLQASTDITFEVRASDSVFLKDAATPSWRAVGGTSPVVSGLPSGRYQQWRATLTSTDSANTPTLSEVTVYYYR